MHGVAPVRLSVRLVLGCVFILHLLLLKQPHTLIYGASVSGGYIMRACSEGGVYEQEIVDDEGVVISARGRLP